MEKGTKHCPYCGEEIPTMAKKCRYCGEWLPGESPTSASHITPSPQVTTQTTKTSVTTDDNDEDTPWYEKISLFFSCLGMGLFEFGIPIALFIIALCTVPSEEKQERVIKEDVVTCVKDHTESVAGALGDGIGTLTSLFMSSSMTDSSIQKSFEAQNTIKVKKYWLWSIGKICNEDNPDGTTVSFGAFGIVIPFVSWDDFKLMSDEDKERILNDE